MLKPKGKISRATLSKQLNPNLVSILSSKSKKILESKKFYSSPRQTSVLSSLPPSSSRALVVRKVTPSPQQSRNTGIDMKPPRSKRRNPTERKYSNVQFEDNTTQKSGEHYSSSTMTLQASAIKYIHGEVQRLNDIQSKIMLVHRKSRRFDESDLKHLCEPRIVEGILHYHKEKEKISSSSIQRGKRGQTGPPFVSSDKGQCSNNRSARKGVNFVQPSTNQTSNQIQHQSQKRLKYARRSYETPISCHNKKINSQYDYIAESEFEGCSNEQISNYEPPKSDPIISLSKQKQQSVYSSSEAASNPSKKPALSPYGTTWLELKLDSSSSDDIDVHESFGNINIRNKSGCKKKKSRQNTASLESKDVGDDFDEDDKMSYVSLSDVEEMAAPTSLAHHETNKPRKSRHTSNIDSLQVLGFQ